MEAKQKYILHGIGKIVEIQCKVLCEGNCLELLHKDKMCRSGDAGNYDDQFLNKLIDGRGYFCGMCDHVRHPDDDELSGDINFILGGVLMVEQDHSNLLEFEQIELSGTQLKRMIIDSGFSPEFELCKQSVKELMIFLENVSEAVNTDVTLTMRGICSDLPEIVEVNYLSSCKRNHTEPYSDMVKCNCDSCDEEPTCDGWGWQDMIKGQLFGRNYKTEKTLCLMNVPSETPARKRTSSESDSMPDHQPESPVKVKRKKLTLRHKRQGVLEEDRPITPSGKPRKRLHLNSESSSDTVDLSDIPQTLPMDDI